MKIVIDITKTAVGVVGGANSWVARELTHARIM
jgi:hypothetical protein